jgi:hypothetical protein
MLPLSTHLFSHWSIPLRACTSNCTLYSIPVYMPNFLCLMITPQIIPILVVSFNELASGYDIGPILPVHYTYNSQERRKSISETLFRNGYLWTFRWGKVSHFLSQSNKWNGHTKCLKGIIIRTYIEHQSSCPVIWIGSSPTPPPKASVPLPRTQVWGRHTRLLGRDPIQTTGQ